MYSHPFAGFVTGTVTKMGPKESDYFIAEEQKGWVPRVEMVLYKGRRTSSCIQKTAWKKAGEGGGLLEADEDQWRCKNGRSVLKVRMLPGAVGGSWPQGLGDGADVMAVVPAKQENVSSCF